MRVPGVSNGEGAVVTAAGTGRDGHATSRDHRLAAWGGQRIRTMQHSYAWQEWERLSTYESTQV